jgi:hypothetical protein
VSKEVRILLSREEMATASQGASMRWQLARAAGVANQKHDESRDDAEIDTLGLKAEIAVAKAYGIPHHPLMSGIDDGMDMFAGDVGIDVKASFHSDGNLLFKKRAAFKADVGVLVTQGFEDNLMVIRGWVMRERFLEEADLKKVGDAGRALIMPQSRLSPPESLWRYITQSSLGAVA